MKFFWKLFLSIMLSVLLCVCIGGSVLIQINFQSSLNREKENARKQNGLVYQMLKRKLVREPEFLIENHQEDLQETVRKEAEALSGQLTIGGLQFQITDAEGKVIFSGTEVQTKDKKLVVPQKQEYISWIDCAGQTYNLFGVRLIEAGSEAYIVKTVYDVTQVYQDKLEQYGHFRIITWIVMAICCMTALGISWLFLRPIHRLSHAVDRIFEGDYDIRVPVKGEDEISSLSRNFNRMAKKIKESIWEIEEYSRKQQRFTDNFAHELKTPLTSMIGYADMLRSKKLTEEQTVVYADRIVREGKRLEAMSMKLMQLIVLKKQDFRLRKISAAAFFEQVKETVLPVLNNEGITFRINAEEALIFIEPDLMKTVLVNLVDNARKAVADQGLIEIRGSLKGNVYQICVRDNGCGMEESEVENAAEAFYMADKSRSRKKGGAGLGLSICREIVDVHKGRMIIKSRPQMGTAVTVLIGGEKIEA